MKKGGGMKRILMTTAMVFGLGFASPLFAQDAQTLADLRQEAAVLSVEIVKLKRELSTTGAPNTAFGGTSTLERVDLFEASLTKLTSKIEQLEFRLDQIVSDGTRQLDDMNFRICDLEAACDVGNLPALEPLGGAEAASGASDIVVVGPGSQPDMEGGQLAEAEQADFDAAMTAYSEGSYDIAASGFGAFAQNYTGGFLTAEAHFMRGEALNKLGQTSEAARSYLDSFNTSSEGERAPTALLRLGSSMVALGHMDKGCVMLGEVGSRFPGSQESTQADAERQTLGCQ
ncbi:tol-pal system protein YbgF [Pacificibacter marinus]|uniref:Cell division coordinator CpoB n=2 Tax=Pacificibacter marinus TaxID=658057 RepID=A0A1Y5RH34_9RHOB|nr:tol-pal system protein YbgF [Pacificibacter marinus]SLN17009.1 tol-pal system protein YbgF [Pacificibacter marinus]